MPKIKKRKALAATVVTLITVLGIQNAMAEKAALVFDQVCKDTFPSDILELKWLSSTKGLTNVFTMGPQGGVRALTPWSPKFEDVTHLIVLGHGNCDELGGMVSKVFADKLATAFNGKKPRLIELGVCEGGATKKNSPSKQLVKVFNNETSVYAYNNTVGLYGSGNKSLDAFNFGPSSVLNSEYAANKHDDLDDNIQAKWEGLNPEEPNQYNCTKALLSPAQLPIESKFLNFVDFTYSFYASPQATEGGYNIMDFYSLKYPTTQTVCGPALPGYEQGQAICATAE